jgi:hypothetical protein
MTRIVDFRSSARRIVIRTKVAYQRRNLTNRRRDKRTWHVVIQVPDGTRISPCRSGGRGQVKAQYPIISMVIYAQWCGSPISATAASLR